MENESMQLLNTVLRQECVSVSAQEMLISDMGAVIFRRVMQRVWNSLEYADQGTLLLLMESSAREPGDEEKNNAVFAFLTSHVPELERYTKEEQTAFVETYQSLLGELSA